MRIQILMIGFTIFISCNNNSWEKENVEDSTVTKQPEKSTDDPEICYMKVKGRDTVLLMLKQKGNALTGKLMFDNYQYDGSSGTVSGKQEGEIIKLWYDFFSEGMHSMMEIYFKKENENLIRGMGDMDRKADTTYFKDPSGISYPVSETFKKTDCSVLKEKLN